jgi:outer membrane protein assembly factor BamD
MKNFNFCFILFLLWSCSSEKPKGKTEAEVLYKEAQELIKDERFILATEKLTQLKNQYPYSFYATPAELLQADVLYMQENYVEAAAAYLMFRDLHPKHQDLHYVIFKIAESYYYQVPDGHDRDLTSCVEAIKYYKELNEKYSESKYKGKSLKRILSCETKMRLKDEYIADFYFKTDEYSAARWRYLEIMTNYKNKDLRKKSITRIVETSLYLKQFKKCLKYYNEYKNEFSDKYFVEDLKELYLKCKNKDA